MCRALVIDEAATEGGDDRRSAVDLVGRAAELLHENADQGRHAGSDNRTNMIPNARDHSRRRLGVRPGPSPATTSRFTMCPAPNRCRRLPLSSKFNLSFLVGQVPVRPHIPSHHFERSFGVWRFRVQKVGECGTIEETAATRTGG